MQTKARGLVERELLLAGRRGHRVRGQGRETVGEVSKNERHERDQTVQTKLSLATVFCRSGTELGDNHTPIQTDTDTRSSRYRGPRLCGQDQLYREG